MSANRPELRRAVFIDRDGTLHVEKGYLCHAEDLEFFPGVPQAIGQLRQAGFLVIVITNQSGVARGYFTLFEVNLVHRHIQALLKREGTTIDAFYVCPHHPEGIPPFRTTCLCRKGHPGMLLQAAADFGIDLPNSFMIGDKTSDIEAGRNAGCRPLLVLTGYGEETARKILPENVLTFADLPGAVEYILSLS
ncbi:MAG: HAD family hydrolase [Desulfuromonadaceae bacterium]|nr:HAD family hydrolase [Desulfuromonadaceae bacterium]